MFPESNGNMIGLRAMSLTVATEYAESNGVISFLESNQDAIEFGRGVV